ncbi:hypothetical protein NPIL_31631 [Nephila pilipes]|uniref:Uncharacterized protein n=1 Tax=Nephila pilipes TaxID=299642 RepID=A0A8X6QFJ6_NEPPI|nr:hypothetical protein NPIL_31631 [Nephila pilipes]
MLLSSHPTHSSLILGPLSIVIVCHGSRAPAQRTGVAMPHMCNITPGSLPFERGGFPSMCNVTAERSLPPICERPLIQLWH